MISVPDAQKNAWWMLAAKKNEVVTDLSTRELELQGLLLNVPDDQISTRLGEYRKKHGELVDTRKAFTGIITDKLITPLMETEKRADPKVNASYLALSARELELRKAATSKLLLDQNIATEKGQFKAHFQNEYMRLATAYRHTLSGIAQQAYTSCLEAKTPPDEIDTALAVARLAMADTKLGTPNKFTRVHLTPEDAAALYKQLHTPDTGEMLKEGMDLLREKFAMYANDLENAEAAIQDSQREFEATIVEDNRDLSNETAANVLMASAESFILPDSNFKPVTTLEKIVIEDNSESWVVKIISAFLANFAVAFNKTSVKKYSGLTIKQMAEALDKAGVRVQGVNYTTVDK